MSNNWAFLVSSFKKTDACKPMVESLINGGYLTEGNTLILCDDNAGGPNSKEDPETMIDVFNLYKKEIPDLRLRYGASRGGISINKNRGLHEVFKTPEKWDNVCLLDDDFTIKRAGLCEELLGASEADRQDHICTSWERAGLWLAFPPRQKSEHCSWSTGVQGNFLFFKMDLLKAIGYYPKYIHMYAYEHVSQSSRALMYQGYCPELYPTLLRSDRYIQPQSIPNRYAIDPDKLHGNSPQFWADMQRIRQGLDLKIDESHLPKKGEVCLTNKK